MQSDEQWTVGALRVLIDGYGDACLCMGVVQPAGRAAEQARARRFLADIGTALADIDRRLQEVKHERPPAEPADMTPPTASPEGDAVGYHCPSLFDSAVAAPGVAFTAEDLAGDDARPDGHEGETIQSPGGVASGGRVPEGATGDAAPTAAPPGPGDRGTGIHPLAVAVLDGIEAIFDASKAHDAPGFHDSIRARDIATAAWRDAGFPRHAG